jgi:AraC-like DNA-binding protein
MNQIWDDLNIQLDYFVNRTCQPDWKLDEEKISFHNLMFLYSGQCDFYINDRHYSLQAGDVVYAPSGIIRKANTCADNLMRCYAAAFQILSTSNESKLLPALLHIGLDPILIDLLRQIDQIWLEKEAGYLLRTRALILLVLARLHQIECGSTNSQPEDYRISRIKRIIAEKLSEHLTVKSLAAGIELNPVYLGQLFHRQTGQTIHAYMTRLRIQRACDLLQNSRCMISEVAWQCGFDDLCIFSKTFKKTTGNTPSEYVRLHKTDN